VKANDPVKILDAIVYFGAGIATTVDHRIGEEVVARANSVYAVAASDLAAVEGGDGVHEHVVSETSLNDYQTALDASSNDLFDFGYPNESLEWETTDYNAMPGRIQSVNYSPIPTLLFFQTISRVEISWPAEDYANAQTLAKSHAMARPRRRCSASHVTSGEVMDVVAVAKDK
jgi:hypothetical protein